MKTTSYEISKKLDEIGFNSYSPCYVKHLTKPKAIQYHSYDLETILTALPQSIEVNGRHYHFNLEHGGVCYETGDLENYDLIYNIQQENNETITDLAAMLLILLHEKGLIEFE